MRNLIAVITLVLAGAAGAAAQSVPAEPVPGERVYTITGGRRIEGTLVSLSDSVVIETPSGESVARARPSEIFRHTGHVSMGRGFLRGAGIGAVAGMGVGAIIGYADGDDPENMFIAFSAEDKAILGGVVVGAAGLLVGGILGAATSGDRWERVPLRPRVTTGPAVAGTRLELGFEARF